MNVHAVDALDYDDDDDVEFITATAADADIKTASLAHLGVHTIDELLDSDGHGVESGLRLQYESDCESVQSSSRLASPAATTPLRSILSVTPRSLTPKSSRSRVRLMDELAEVRSMSPSPISTIRSRSPSPVSTARSQSVVSVPEEKEILTGRSAASVQTAVTNSSNSSSSSSSSSSQSETGARPRRYTSRRRSSVSSGRMSRRTSEIATMTYSEDFTSARSSIEYSEHTSSVRDVNVTDRRQRHKKRSSPTHTSHRYAVSFMLTQVLSSESTRKRERCPFAQASVGGEGRMSYR